MDVVIPLKRGARLEIRYCLRSIAANVPHDRVWLVGWIPPNVTGVGKIPIRQYSNKWLNTKRNLRAVCNHPEVSERFILFNDDFFVMKPVVQVPALHAGTLAAHHVRCQARVGLSGYVRALGRTRERLVGLGVAEPLSYDLHVPIVMDKAGLLAALDLIGDDYRLHERSVYANLAGLGGEKVTDVKVFTAEEAIPSGPFLSTSDTAFRWYPVGRHIRRTFPTRSRYERRLT